MREKVTRIMLILLVISIFEFSFSESYAGATTFSSTGDSLVAGKGTVIVKETVTVNVTVTNVTNLMSWRIRVFYDVSLVNCTAAWLPDDNVFAGKNPFWDWRVDFRDGRWCVQMGASIIPLLSGVFNGSGTLCRLNFTAHETLGVSALEFSKPYGEFTFLMYATPPDYTETGYIPLDEISDGSVEVVQPPPWPVITVVSPENKTYETNSVPLNFTVDKPASWIGYSLDGEANVTIVGNTTLTNLSYGAHGIKVCANDTSGNMGSSDEVHFTVRLLCDLDFDKKVTVADVLLAVYAFGSYPTRPNWNPIADLNQDGKVDVSDILIVALDFGRTWE